MPTSSSGKKPGKSSGTPTEPAHAPPSEVTDTDVPKQPAGSAPPDPEWPPTTASTTGNVVTTKSEQPAEEEDSVESITESGTGVTDSLESAPAEAEPTPSADEPAADSPKPVDASTPADATSADSDPAPAPDPIFSAEPEPAATVEPATSDEPAVSDEPDTSGEPAASGELSASRKPINSGKPSASYEPTVSSKESASYEPAISVKSTTSDEPAGEADGESEPVTEAVAVERAQRAEPDRPGAPAPPVEPPPAVGTLATALSQLRATIGGATYPLVMPSADEARRVGTALVSQLDDYLLPRLARLDAPLLVVVGGSTGAGKSTLVNSLVRAPVSAAGVLRPTTRSPVLVSHPSDSSWFRKGELLPGLTRTAESTPDPQALQLVSAPALGPGLAFLDAPDIDSVVDRNRQLAAQLLAAADLWLFVTTAARYADAVPWELLKTARVRGTVIALVLNRVPPEATGEVSAHLSEMLAAYDMDAVPLFVLPETFLDGQGLLPEEDIKPLQDWFTQLASDVNARTAVVRQTLDGALAALRPATDGLAAAADEQVVAAKSLDERVSTAYRTAYRTMEEGVRDGRLLRGEVLARWQEFVGTGEFLKTLESRVGHLRDRLMAALTGRRAPAENLRTALESQLVTLLRGVAADAAEQAYAAWQAHPAGAALLEPSLQRPSPDLPQRAERLVRDWQQFVLDLVRTEAADKRVVARGAAYAVNGLGLAVMIGVFTTTAFIPTGLEVAVGAGTTVAAQKVLEAIFGDQAIRTLATRAREDLLNRVNVLLDAEATRYFDRTAAVGVDLEPAARLRDVAADVERAREELALTATAPSLAAGLSHQASPR